MDVRRYGARALLVTMTVGVRPAAFAEVVRGARLGGVVDVVPGATTVVITVVDATVLSSVRDSVAALEGEVGERSDGSAPPPSTVVVDVLYGGEDLGEVARAVGRSVDDVVAAHSGAVYTCEFCGFAPGFAYLSGLDEWLVLPRRKTPRTSVPAGSVAIAGPYSAVYPSASPGGWHLLGRTAAALWDVDRDPPALITPGTRVRFRPAGTIWVPTVTDPLRTAPRSSNGTQDTQIGGRAALRVVTAGVATSIQDRGRPAWAHLAVTHSGALDRTAAALVNRLVGDHADAAVVETAGGLVVEATAPVVVADSTTGAVRSVGAGERVMVDPAAGEQWAYLAVRGGIAVEAVLGSRSWDTLGRIGPPPPEPADVLAAGPDPGSQLNADLAPRAARDDTATPRIWPGPHPERFGADAFTALTSSTWQVTTSSRVGVRLDGPPLPLADTADRPSEGLVRGAVQVPPDGQPVVLLADHPTTGGYPVIAIVDDADVDRLAQRRPGASVRFAVIDRMLR